MPPWDLTTRIIGAIDHSSNSTMAFTKNFTSRIFCKCKCHCWVRRMIDSHYYSSRKIPERCENSFVNYRINYQKLCYSLRRIWTQPVNQTCSDSMYSIVFALHAGKTFQLIYDQESKGTEPKEGRILSGLNITEMCRQLLLFSYNFQGGVFPALSKLK